MTSGRARHSVAQYVLSRLDVLKKREREGEGGQMGSATKKLPLKSHAMPCCGLGKPGESSSFNQWYGRQGSRKGGGGRQGRNISKWLARHFQIVEGR